MGRYLDSQGKLPKPWIDGYKDEADDEAAVGHRPGRGHQGARRTSSSSGTGENEAQAAFRTNGAVLGLSWDSTGCNLRKDGFGFIAPKEGAFAWNQGYVLLKNAKNVEQAHEFAKWVVHARRLGRLGDGLPRQPGRQGRHRSRPSRGQGVLPGGLSGRRPAEAVVVAGAGRLVPQAARRVRRQVQGGLT